MKLKFTYKCPKKWKELNPIEGSSSRFCEECKKKVYDLQKKSFQEIKDLFESQKGNVCGVYKKPTPRVNFIFLIALFLVFNVSLFSGISQEQMDSIQTVTDSLVFNDTVQVNFSFEGMVVDETGEPLPFVNVVVYKGEEIVFGESTDFDGKFKIGFKKEEVVDYRVEFSFIGYKKFEINLNELEKVITLQELEGALMGDFIIHYTPSLVNPHENPNETIYNREDIRRLPRRD